MASRISCLWLRWISTRTLRRFETIWGDPITHHRTVHRPADSHQFIGHFMHST